MLQNWDKSIDSTLALVWIKYIQILINIEDYSKAYSWAQRLYAANQNDPEAILLIASLKRHFGELDEAIILNRKVLEKVNRSGNSVYLNELGYSLLAKGKGKEAYNIYKDGYGDSIFGGLMSKYQLKVSFLEDNVEQGSIEI